MSNEVRSTSAVDVLVIAEESQAAIAGETLIPLSRREWEVLAELVRVPGRAKTIEELAHGNPRAVKYVIRRLRRKLADQGLQRVLVHHHGWGYRYIGPVRKVQTIHDAA